MAQTDTFSSLLAEATRALAESGSDSPKLDARLLLQGASGLAYAELISASRSPVDMQTSESFRSMLEQRIAGKSVHRILGFREFYGHKFVVSQDTLEPRPDTEILIDVVISDIAVSDAELHFADLGTGTGAIAISLLKHFANATAMATDISSGALQTAQQNATTLGVADQLKLVKTEYLDDVEGPFDFIVSNPPYIPTGNIADLEREVRDHDPHIALDGGDDGLAAYRKILAGCKSKLKEGGKLYLEIGFDQEAALRSLAEINHWRFERCISDLAGNPRVVILGFGEEC